MAKRPNITVIAVISFIPMGCGIDGPTVELPYPYTGEDDAGRGGDTVLVGQGAGDPSTTSSGAGGAPSTTGSSSSGIGTASSGPSGGGPGACVPDGGDSACVLCAKELCCAEVEACVSDPGCLCWVQCVGDSGDFALCAGQCAVPSDATLALLECGEAFCTAQCGG
jgi:hypothetical protein